MKGVIHFSEFNHLLWVALCFTVLLGIAGCKSATAPEEPDPKTEEPQPSVDTEPPAVSVISPGQDEEIRNEYTIKIDASDNNEIESVSLYLNGEILGTANTAPYEWPVTTTEFYNESYTLFAKAKDKAGNEATSDTVTFSVLNYLLVLNLKESWFDQEGYIIVTDTDGSIIDEEQFWRSGTYYLYPPDPANDVAYNSQNFSEIDITLISNPIGVADPERFVRLRTHLNANAWSEWTWGDDNVYDNWGNVNLNYADTASYANHQGYVVSSNRGSSFGLTEHITEISEITIWEQPGSQYLATDIANSPRYLKLENLFDGDNVTVDLGAAQNMTSKTVSLPSSSAPNQLLNYVFGRTTGAEPGSWSSYVGFAEITDSAFDTYYPADAFPGYESYIITTYDGDDGIHYYYSRGIPDQASKLSIDVVFQNASTDNFHIAVQGDEFDEMVTYSAYAPTESKFSHWIVYGPSDRTAFSFPDIGMSGGFKATYPNFDRNSFEISSVDLYRYPELQNGYREYYQRRYENGGQAYYEVISEYINYWEFYSSSAKEKQLLGRMMPEKRNNLRSRYSDKNTNVWKR